jgi:hypothetical protein
MAEPVVPVVIGVVLAVMTVVSVGASLTGNGQRLCDAMGGVYTPQASPGEVCPGGSWANLFRSIKKPEPTK